MKHLQDKIRELDLKIYANKALLTQQTSLLREKTQSPNFFAAILLGSFVFGYFLMAKRSLASGLFATIKKALTHARVLLHFFPL